MISPSVVRISNERIAEGAEELHSCSATRPARFLRILCIGTYAKRQ